jgi:alanyl-tRNA synthetase
VQKRFDELGISIEQDRCVIPEDDNSTLFVCSGMQRFKSRFRRPDGGQLGSLQSCVRTDDIDLVGDGTHLTYFEMMGNFSFGRDDYHLSIDLWHGILSDLRVPVTEIRCHPTRSDHRSVWERLGYRVVSDNSCEWSDGEIGGHCCEVFCGELEIGNLVNPLGHSVDVGFGWERLHQVVEQVQRVEQTSLFDPNLEPIVSDHVRTISILRENGVEPGNRGRSYVCRRLLRRMLRHSPLPRLEFDDWLQHERDLRERSLRSGKRYWRKHPHQSKQFWWETFGILPEEIDLLRLS